MSMIDPSRPILVYLANGVQGGEVVRAALCRGLAVRALVRDLARASNLSLPGVELVRGDLHDADSLRTASAGVAHAVLQIPTGPEDEMRAQAANALAAATACGVHSIVLKLASASRQAPCMEPSFVANAAVENMVRRSGVPFAIVRPTMYLDNLLKPSARREILEQGVFAPPIAEGQSIAWTSAHDCAEAAVILLERGAMGGDHRIAGPESVRGDELAARLSAALARTISYRAQTVEVFETELSAVMGPAAACQVASKFRYFRDYPHEANQILATAFQPSAPLAGFVPMRIETWALQRLKHLW